MKTKLTQDRNGFIELNDGNGPARHFKTERIGYGGLQEWRNGEWVFVGRNLEPSDTYIQITEGESTLSAVKKEHKRSFQSCVVT